LLHWCGEKGGFESFDDQNLFLFTDIFRSLPTTNAVFPSLVIELKVTGIVAKSQELTSQFLTFSHVSGLLSKVRIDRSDPNFQLKTHIV
jgi:hypothetical protein